MGLVTLVQQGLWTTDPTITAENDRTWQVLHL
jgi:hypothetical protein